MIWKIPFCLKCWIFLLSFSSVTNKLTSALKPPQENEFWSTSKPSTSPRTPIASTMETDKEVTSPSETSRLTRLEEEISRLNHKFSLQDSKNTEYDKTVDFIKEFKTKQTESEPSQKREIETLKEIVSGVQSKEETKNYEMKQLKERLDQIETQMSEDHHDIVKRQNPITSKPNITTRLPCMPKNPCAFDFKSESVSASTSDKIATSTSSSALDNISKSTNLPSSCKDLWTNGHTSNGIYLLYDRNTKKVSATFCGFNNNKSSQLLLGFVNVKSLPKGVHFYAQRTEIFEQVDAVISFDRVLMNEGGGLNGRTGIFRAPKSGIYQFLFHGSKSEDENEHLHIDLRVNGVNVGNAFARHYDYAKMLPVGVHSVVRLKTGDEVILFKKGEGWLYDDDTPDTHYSGWLVEEELTILKNQFIRHHMQQTMRWTNV